MSAWMGGGQHLMVEAGVIECLECKWWCRTGYPCRCCLAAKVQRLRAGLAERDRRIAAALEDLDSWAKFERDMGNHLSITQISEVLRGESDG